MKKILDIKFYLGVMVFSILLVACEREEKAAQKVDFLDGSFSIVHPASWSTMDDLNEEADLQIGNSPKQAYMLILSEDKIDFDNMTLEGYSDLTRPFIAETLGNYHESKPEVLEIGDVKALRYRLSGSIGSVKLIYWHVTLETKNHYHQMLLWSVPSKFSTNEATFNDVIQSFKVQ
jgi:hypothetical protein